MRDGLCGGSTPYRRRAGAGQSPTAAGTAPALEGAAKSPGQNGAIRLNGANRGAPGTVGPPSGVFGVPAGVLAPLPDPSERRHPPVSRSLPGCPGGRKRPTLTRRFHGTIGPPPGAAGAYRAPVGDRPHRARTACGRGSAVTRGTGQGRCRALWGEAGRGGAGRGGARRGGARRAGRRSTGRGGPGVERWKTGGDPGSLGAGCERSRHVVEASSQEEGPGQARGQPRPSPPVLSG